MVKRLWWLAAVAVLAGCDSGTSAPVAEKPSPSPSTDSRCTEVIAAVAYTTQLQFQPSGGGAAAGNEQCSGTAGADTVRVVLHNRVEGTDTPESLLAGAKTASGDCTTEIEAPLDGVGEATSCLTGTTGTTTLVFESGWIVVQIATAEDAKDLSQKGAVAAVAVI